MFYAIGLWESFKLLFSEMSIMSFVCILVGMMLVVIEFFQNTRKVLGIMGAVLILSGITIRMLLGGTLSILFIMIFVIVSVLLVFHVLMLFIQKQNWLLQSLSLALNNADYIAQKKVGYDYLKDLTGIATTDINETGHITINDINFFVTANELIKKGSTVRVLSADGEKIVVENLGDEFYIPPTKSETMSKTSTITKPKIEINDSKNNVE